MGEVTYTKEQQRVIEERNANLLVSAAAGSGKTAVLTERILSLLSDKENPTDIDRMLIVTFTNAAASEMRERIGVAIEKFMEKEPGNRWMQRQIALLPNAQITTIDSFCLFLIRNNFGDIGLDPGFRILDEGERKLLMQEVLSNLLESHYAKEKEEDFFHLVECYCPDGKEKELEKQILSLYEFSMSMPYPMEWLEGSLTDYSEENCAFPENCEWWSLGDNAREALVKEIAKKSREGYELCMEEAGPKGYTPCLEAMKKLGEALKQNPSYEARYKILKDTALPALSKAKGKEEDPELREAAKKLRDEAKQMLESLQDSYYFASWEEIKEDMVYAGRTVNMLVTLVMEFSRLFAETKREKNVIDFADMEHFALDILIQKDGDVIQPTKAALEYRDYFSHIMVDEYQDSNYVQEYILKSITGDDNYFMVGDVKQSIYRFRQARPEIFLQKYQTYGESGPSIRIDLNKNFRSREEVLESVNDVFDKIMTPATANMAYDEKAKLYVGATYPKKEEGVNRTELVLIQKPEEEVRKEIGADSGRHDVEAFWVAEKIREMMATPFLVTDKSSGQLRPVAYKDIVILLRSMDGWEGDFRRILEQKGIPAYSSVKNGYFAAMEIRTILNFLQVLANPRQDIPLYGVMTSYFGGFSEEEAALIKGCGKETEKENGKASDLFGALLSCEQKEVGEKKEKLLKCIEYYRNKIPYVSIRNLLELIYRETGYLDYMTALPGGSKRRANLLLLLEKAKSFEATSYHGLFHFIRYIGQLKEQEVDYGEAGILDENADVVRIMTIHKSKGLEFPVCFLCGMGKRINKKDAAKMILADSDLGLGVDCINPKMRSKRVSLKKKQMAQKIIADCIAEEMRVLYVAMTRAKEKLFMTGVVEEIETTLDKAPGKGELSEYQILHASTYLDFVLGAYADRDKLTYYLHTVMPDDLLSMEWKEEMESTVNREKLKELSLEETDEQRLLKEKFAFTYPYPALKGLYTKTTVSELKKAAYEEEDGKPMFEEAEDTPYEPFFVRKEEVQSAGTLRGSAYHRILELLPFAELFGKNLGEKERTKWIEKVLEENLHNKKMSAEYASLIAADKCGKFLETSLSRRMAEADAKGLLYKEKPFFMGVPAKELQESFPETETILVQGVIDVYFEEEGELVVADYKTDRVTAPEELVQRYRSQLAIYARALEQITGKRVKEKIIYSFALNKEIQV